MANKYNINTAVLSGARVKIGSALDSVLDQARYTSSSAAMEALNEAFEQLRKADYAIIRAQNISL
jgi:hypothetical protein